MTLVSYPHGKVRLKAIVEGKADMGTSSETPFMHAVLGGAKLYVKVLFFNNRYRTKDGSYKQFEWVGTEGESGLVYAVARDVTGKKEAEEKAQ